jgi:hypothetical protein
VNEIVARSQEEGREFLKRRDDGDFVTVLCCKVLADAVAVVSCGCCRLGYNECTGLQRLENFLSVSSPYR